MTIHALQRSKKIQQQQQQQEKGRRRFLITVNVLGSAGPLRFLVNEEDLVATVIDTVLRSYARERRLPVLGFDLDNFLLYSANAGSDALSPKERIGACGGRNFLLCKKQQAANEGSSPGRKGGGSWKAWLDKALNLKVYSH